jgi:hypothetical protein
MMQIIESIVQSRTHTLTQCILKAETEKQVERLLNSFIHQNFFVTAAGKPAAKSTIKRKIKKLRNHLDSLIFLNAEPSLIKDGVHYSVIYLKQQEQGLV